MRGVKGKGKAGLGEVHCVHGAAYYQSGSGAEGKGVASLTGETITEAVRASIDERLCRIAAKSKERPAETVDSILALVRGFNLQRINNDLTEDEILGYGPNGYCK